MLWRFHIKLSLLILFFCVDIRVQADSPSTQKALPVKTLSVVLYPEGCLQGVTECAIRTKEKNFAYQGEGYEFVLGSESVVIRHSSEELTLVKGSLWVRSDTPFKVKTEYGSVYSREALNTFFLKDESQLEIMPLSGSVMVERQGDEHDLLLPSGYRTFLSGVNEGGKAKYDIPTAANFKKIIEKWTPLFQGSSKDLVHFLNQYRSRWTTAVVEGTELHVDLYQRTVAEAKERERQARLREAAIRRENARLRELFRQKNYLE